MSGKFQKILEKYQDLRIVKEIWGFEELMMPEEMQASGELMKFEVLKKNKISESELWMIW